SRQLIESLLSRWTPEDGPSFNAYRTALLTEAGVLRTRVAEDADATFISKVAAIEALKSLQRLAELDLDQGIATAGRLAVNR
ncbi:MAG: hypothetical protein KDA61_20425, partial [Planctomycetales bacterium]|nr:hypothetical protein [Planctomycetales bacterium]